MFKEVGILNREKIEKDKEISRDSITYLQNWRQSAPRAQLWMFYK